MNSDQTSPSENLVSIQLPVELVPSLPDDKDWFEVNPDPASLVGKKQHLINITPIEQNSLPINPEDAFDINCPYCPGGSAPIDDDWFEAHSTPITMKHRYPINITKPPDANIRSMKGQSHDIRGAPINPRFVLSPWLPSSIEPDTNHKPLY